MFSTLAVSINAIVIIRSITSLVIMSLILRDRILSLIRLAIMMFGGSSGSSSSSSGVRGILSRPLSTILMVAGLLSVLALIRITSIIISSNLLVLKVCLCCFCSVALLHERSHACNEGAQTGIHEWARRRTGALHAGSVLALGPCLAGEPQGRAPPKARQLIAGEATQQECSGGG